MTLQITIMQVRNNESGQDTHVAELTRSSTFSDESLATGKGSTAAEAILALATRMMVGASRIASEISANVTA